MEFLGLEGEEDKDYKEISTKLLISTPKIQINSPDRKNKFSKIRKSKNSPVSPFLYDEIHMNIRLSRSLKLHGAKGMSVRKLQSGNEHMFRYKLNNAVIAKKYEEVFNIVSTRNINQNTHFESVIRYSNSKGDWKTLSCLLLYSKTMIPCRDILDGIRDLISFGINMTIEVIQQQICFQLCSSSLCHVNNHHIKKIIEPITIQEIMCILQKDDLVLLVNVYIRFHLAGVTELEFCYMETDQFMISSYDEKKKQKKSSSSRRKVNLIEFSIISSSTYCTTFLLELASGRLK